jgi:putative effector of murein hydrolase LrgA (UPF0299 family)
MVAMVNQVAWVTLQTFSGNNIREYFSADMSSSILCMELMNAI